jgi:hypothetical protein
MKLLPEILFARAPEDQRAWLERVWLRDASSADLNAIRAALAAMGRRLGASKLPPEDSQRLEQELGEVAASCDLACLGRIALVLRALELLPVHEHVPFVRQLYLRGDFAEQVAVLRSLPHAPQPARFAELAIEACRTNVLDVFAAIACENPFPAQHMAAPNFNQMVLKAIFMGLDTHRIAGLRTRVTAELKRMVADFASERRAAGRTVPADTDYILSLHPC